MFETRFWMGKSKIKMPKKCGAKYPASWTPWHRAFAGCASGRNAGAWLFANLFAPGKFWDQIVRSVASGWWAWWLDLQCWPVWMSPRGPMFEDFLLDSSVGHWIFGSYYRQALSILLGIRCLGVIWSTSGNSRLRRVTAEIWKVDPVTGWSFPAKRWWSVLLYGLKTWNHQAQEGWW